MLYLVQEGYTGSAKIAELRRQLGDPSVWEPNTTTLDGQRLLLGDLIAAAGALPFLADRRLVIVRHLLSRANVRAERERRDDERALIAYLERVPPTTDLVFVEESISATSPLVKAIERLKGIIVREPERQGAALEEWLIAQAAERGGTLTPDAATALASTSDLRSGEVESLRLIGEMEKLLTYANGQPVQAHDVRLLVPEAHVVEIFAFTDALSSRNRLLALRRLHDLRQRDAAFPYLLVMIGRQLRLLLRAQELDAAHIDIPQAASELKLPPGVVRGLLNQARRFHRDELVHALQRIVALDAAFKTGTLAEREDVALDLLVVELTGR